MSGELYKLIIADDEPIIVEGLSAFPWHNFGFQLVGTAFNGKQAVERMHEHAAHALITDILMPLMNGIEVCEAVRADYPACKMAIISGHTDFEYAQSAIRIGITDYLLKPIELSELANLAERLHSVLEEEHARSNLNDAGRDKLQSANSSYGHAVHQAIEYMEKHFREKITLSQVADHVYLNASYFSLLFKKETGLNFVDYLKQFRMNKAKAYMLRADLKMYEIGEMVGYPDRKYFTDTFKRFTGVTPLEYRQKIFQN